jgi:hypothetical protein
MLQTNTEAAKYSKKIPTFKMNEKYAFLWGYNRENETFC